MKNRKRIERRCAIKLNINLKRVWIGFIPALVSFLLCNAANISGCVIFLIPIVFLLISLVKLQCSPTLTKVILSLWSIVATFVAVFTSQLLLNEKTLELGIHRILLNMIICGIIIGSIYIISNRIRASVIITMWLLLFLTVINYFVFKFRGSELCPADFLSIGTAVAVVDRYTFVIDAPFAYAVILVMLFSVVIFSIDSYKNNCYKNGRNICIASIFFMVIGFIVGTKNISAYHFLQTGTAENGYFLNFILQIEENNIQKPEGYDIKLVNLLENEYYEKDDYIEPDNFPVIIAIMNESFADLSVLGSDLKTNVEILPFFESLYDNTIKGFALSSVMGGGTANSEYEFLSGNTMGFLPAGSIVYQQFINQTPYTIVSYMNELGYTTIGTHPESKENWLRYSVYPRMGFDETHFIEDYPGERLERGFISDQEMYEQIIEWYEAYPSQEKLFLFGVTMQNHGFYDYEGTDFEKNVFLEGYSGVYLDAEQYLTVLRKSDDALKELITYFENAEREVVILFFGDHFPKLNSEFYKEIHDGESFDNLDEQMLQYTVPFFVWANYDIEEQYVELTSLNYLSNYLLKAAGMELPIYNRFLEEVQTVIPAMNSLAYYSKEQGKFLPYSEATGVEKEILQKYQILQYNCIFDEEEKSALFFPSE